LKYIPETPVRLFESDVTAEKFKGDGSRRDVTMGAAKPPKLEEGIGGTEE
jgi:hypothetical protein